MDVARFSYAGRQCDEDYSHCFEQIVLHAYLYNSTRQVLGWCILMTRSLLIVHNWSESVPVKAGEKIIRFLRRQVREVTEGGLPVLLRKGCSFLLMLAAVPVLFVVRTLRPLVVIRFGRLRGDRIGHFAGNTEVYLCERDAGMHSIRGQRIFDIFYHAPPICNHQLKKMWNRTLHVSRFAGSVDWLNRHLPGGEDHRILMPSGDRDIHGFLSRTRPHLSFTPEEERLGREALQELGIPDGSPFVCFHSRSSAYLDTVYPNENWHYHDYRDSSIEDFTPAAGELVDRGYFAVRMGAVVKELLKITNPMVIDYATKGRTEFLDIFLGAKCYFYIGDPCGIHAIAMIFRRPLAIANMIPLEYAPTWGPNNLFIPKKLWLREEQRFLTFGEIFDSGVGRFPGSLQFEQLRIEAVENTPEEITALAIEMDERLNGTWKITDEDEELQRRFWSLFKPSELNGVFLSHIGTEFLRQNRELLE